MDRFEHKRLCIAPKTAMSMAFKRYLDETLLYQFVHYIDKVKPDDDVIHIETLEADVCDAIIIMSPNHDRHIYHEYLRFVAPEKLYIVSIKEQHYSLSQSVEEPLIDAIEVHSKALDERGVIRKGIAFISKGFIGANNKYLYLDFIRHGIACTLITDNQEQLKELKIHSLPCASLNTQEGDSSIASAKILIFDQGNYTYFYISPHQKTIQLWHGVGLKKMAPHTHITYDYFISTSQWTNDTNFCHIFKAHYFLDYGYPRNAFLQSPQEEHEDLLFCDKHLFEIVKRKHFKKVVLYMPTTREYLFGANASAQDLLPLHLENLNTHLASTDTLMIIKLHPFIVEFFQKTCNMTTLSHIRFHSPDGDVYPILKYTDLLISDYSSIVYDFLLLDRPILFFTYDKKRYEENMGGFLFDYETYSPGEKVTTEKDLIHAISSLEDPFIEERHNMASLFLTQHPTNVLLRQLVKQIEHNNTL